MTKNTRLATAVTAVTATAATAATLLVGGLATPADAAVVRVTDADDSPHGSDLLAVRIADGPRRLLVTTTHDNLRRSPSSGSAGTVFVDTDPSDPGPEFVFVGGYFEGTDYQLLHTDGFGYRTWGDPVDGPHSMRIDYRRDKVRMRMSKTALDGAEEVRIAVRVSGTRRDGTSRGLTDWLDAPRRFTPWVAEG
ncbi:hypothetical protein E8D34_15235 [Nocardioides sp. GY 10113]|uniref:hypothetical protein n=1 Tax=Nocardioides sp. GY 10113 TaxID=2569761 RepID=UPI0010A8D4C5|nr:hypothetical protein [Nocardioides sp. GY 10113]TIC83904.1 hypothetical protein E8D34_15235 [Nocardioides sp. GY 10113]